MKTLNQIMHKL